MAQEYRKFYLSPGQQAPTPGATGISMPDGGIVWIGEAGTFPTEASLGNRLPTDPVFATTYVNHVMSQPELDEYTLMLKYISTVSGGYKELISFDDFSDSGLFEAKKLEIKANVDTLTRD